VLQHPAHCCIALITVVYSYHQVPLLLGRLLSVLWQQTAAVCWLWLQGAKPSPRHSLRLRLLYTFGVVVFPALLLESVLICFVSPLLFFPHPNWVLSECCRAGHALVFGPQHVSRLKHGSGLKPGTITGLIWDCDGGWNRMGTSLAANQPRCNSCLSYLFTDAAQQSCSSLVWHSNA